MTVKEYCKKNNVTVSQLTKMWDKKKFKTFDSYMNSKYSWKPQFKVGDIVVISDGECLDSVFAVIETNSSREEYVICWLSDDLFNDDKFDPMYDYNYGVQKDDWLASLSVVKVGTLDPNLLKTFKTAYEEVKDDEQ